MKKYVLKKNNGFYIFMNDRGLLYGTSEITNALFFKNRESAEKFNLDIFQNKCEVIEV